MVVNLAPSDSPSAFLSYLWLAKNASRLQNLIPDMALLSRFGIGSATIDLIPDETTVAPGGEVEAHLELEGGAEDQTVDDIEIAVVTRFQAEREDDSYPTQYVIWETEFKEGFTVEAGVDRSLNVPPIQVPATAPVTLGAPEVWIQTGLDIDWAVDPSDEDQLRVVPGSHLQGVLDAMEQLGFALDSVVNAEGDDPSAPVPFVQRFTFEREGPPSEIVLTRILSDDATLTIQVARPQPEGRLEDRLTIDTDDAGAIADRLRDEIDALTD